MSLSLLASGSWFASAHRTGVGGVHTSPIKAHSGIAEML